MDRINYNKCPLKKRPIYIINEEVEEINDELENRPIDLSIHNWPLKKLRRNYNDSLANEENINFHRRLESIQEENIVDYKTSNINAYSNNNNNYNNNVREIKKEFNSNLIDLTHENVRELSAENRNYNNNLIKLPNYPGYNNNLNIANFYKQNSNFCIPNISPPTRDASHYENNLEPEDLTIKINSFDPFNSENTNFNIIKNEPTPIFRKEFQDRTNNGLYYQCRICNKCYSTYAALQKHQQTHQQIRDTVLVDHTKNSNQLKQNININNNEQDQQPMQLKINQIQRYHCKDCGKSYSTYSGLTKHEQFHCPHAEGNQIKKSFSCKNCDKVYVSLGALKMHIRTHTLPCKCPLCGKAFSRPWLLQGHIRTHTGEKPFTCQHCKRAFADRSNLRAHLQTHSDVKKYSCQSCVKTFSRMSLLGKHLQGGCPGLQSNDQQQQHNYDISMYHESNSQNMDNFYSENDNCSIRNNDPYLL